MKINVSTVGLAVAGVVMTLVSATSSAVPAFARQTGKACLTCHFQHYPLLNDYGAEFKAAGYTQIGKQKEIKGTDLSIPEVLNASLFLKVRYQKTNGEKTADTQTTNDGELQFPDEFALLLGGRLSENVGYMLEAQLIDGAAPTAAGLKLPFMYDVAGMKMGAVPFTTDALGVSYGFELLNTGAVRNVRANEHRKQTSAQQYINSDGEAAGVALVLWDPTFFVNISKWMPHHLPGGGNGFGGLNANYFRAAYTPTIAEWSTGFGVQVWQGSNIIKTLNDDGTIKDRKDFDATAFDIQAQGIVSNMPLGLYFTYANAPGGNNAFNSEINDKKAMTLLAELGFIPNKATVSMAYRTADNGKASDSKDNALTLGATYQLAQNIQFQLDVSDHSLAQGTSGKQLITLMLSAGF